MEPSCHSSPAGRCPGARLWWAAALVLAVVLMLRAATWMSWWIEQAPVTPFDRTQELLACQWRTLAAATRDVPAGATVTVREAGVEDPMAEMNLHMTAVGLLPDASVVPSSYYGRATPREAARAELVIVHGGDCTVEPGLEPEAKLPHGWLCRRARG